MLSHYSKILDQAVNEIAKLPGIGKRTALRLALHLIKTNVEEVRSLTSSILQLKENLKECPRCFNISDEEVCGICSNPKRNPKVICVVQDIRDVIAIENTHQFQGLYHLLGGVISPMEGIGIQDLKLKELFQRIEEEPIEEVILALPTTPDGDTTNFYIFRNLEGKIDKVTLLARGVGVGEELEYTDEITLGRSLSSRLDFKTVYQ